MAEHLELDEHRSFQEKYWTVQRWAWVGYGIIIVAALLGFAGAGGVFARAQVRAGSHEIDYPRLARWQTQEDISIAFAPSDETERRVLLSPQLGRYVAVDGAQPLPSRSIATALGEELVFLVRPRESGRVTIRIKPDTPGIVRGTGSLDGAPAAVTLIVLP